MTALAAPRILTAEDDPIVSADLRLILEDAGFAVCAGARDGIEAVELAREHRPDLVLLDLGLPRIDGVEAARRILRERDVAVVALTGHSNRESVDRAVAAGATGYVLKPFSDRQLVVTVHEALAYRAERADRETEYARRRLIMMVESMARSGCSEREIERAVRLARADVEAAGWETAPTVGELLLRGLRRLVRA